MFKFDLKYIKKSFNYIFNIELPVTLKKKPSMMNLRQRLDPHYFGNRKLKSARVMSKAGQRNIEALHIPHKSKRFFLDIAHTIVRPLFGKIDKKDKETLFL